MTWAWNPETGTTIFGRDAVGNMISKKVGSGQATNYIYDGRNRLTSIVYPAGTANVVKSYDRNDQVKSSDNGAGRRDYFYTANKALSREVLTADGNSLWVDYAYTGNDALKSMTYSTGLVVDYAPDPLGWPTQALPFAPRIGFQPNGLLADITYANGVVSKFQLDARQRPGSLLVAHSNGTPLVRLNYAYDDSGNVTNITDGLGGLSSRTFTYDALDRLSGINMPQGRGFVAYDGNGNITSQKMGAYGLSYAYDANNSLLSVSGSKSLAFGYDTYGNVISNGRNQFQYDDALQLRCVECGTSAEIRYAYDADGTRISEKKGALSTYFMYGKNGSLLFELNSLGNKREYGYVDGKNIAKKETQ